MLRVTMANGIVAFNIISEKCMTPQLVNKWLTSEHRYPTMLPTDYVKQQFHNCDLIDSFSSPYGEGISEYLIFRKAA
jgi:hypothetical protein